jgi:hypothetical protein
MANLVVTSNTGFVKVVSNIYTADGLPEIMVFNKCTIHEILTEEGIVKVLIASPRDNQTFYLTYPGGATHPSSKHNTMIVDTVNGTAPTSKETLIDLLYQM